jgi:hypothetical protein
VTVHLIKSEPRERLASLLQARDDVKATMADASAAASRLRATTTAPDPIVAQIEQLDAHETTEALEAARLGQDPPAPNAKRREALDRELEAAKIRAAAAARALPSLEAENAKEAGKLAPLNAAIESALAEILCEEAAVLLADFDVANRELAAKADRLNQARDMILRLFEAGGRAHDAAIARENFIGRFERAKARPAPDYDAASQSLLALRGLEAALRSGKTDAKLGDADNATIELPPIFTAPKIEDPASAAVVQSLRSQWGSN